MNLSSTDRMFYKKLQEEKEDVLLSFTKRHYLTPVKKGLVKDKGLMKQLAKDKYLSDWKVFTEEALSAAIVKQRRQINWEEEKEKIEVSDRLVREVSALFQIESSFSKVVLKLGIEKLCNKFEHAYKPYFEFDHNREQINWLYFALYCLQQTYKYNENGKEQNNKLKTHLAYDFAATRKTAYRAQLKPVVDKEYSYNPLLHNRKIKEAFNQLVRKAIKFKKEEASLVTERLSQELKSYYQKKEENKLDYQVIRELELKKRLSKEAHQHLYESSKRKFIGILSKKFEAVSIKDLDDLYHNAVGILFENIHSKMITTDSAHLIGLKTTLKSYLLGIGRNILKEEYSRKEKPSESIPETKDESMNLGDEIRKQEFIRLLGEALSDLNPKHAELIELRFFEGLPIKEIVEITDYNSETLLKLPFSGCKKD